MRLKTRSSISISSTTAEEMDLANQSPSTYEVIDSLGEGSSRAYKVANGVSSQAIDLAGLTEVKFIWVKTTREVTIHVTNGLGTQDNVVTVLDGAEFGYFRLDTSGVTALAASNASGSTARLVVVLAGDPT